MRINRTKLAGATAVVVTAIGGLVAATPATALAAGCSVTGAAVGTTGGRIYATCTGVSSFRSDALCEENSGARYHAYGAWVGSGGQSTSRCDEYSWLAGRGANIRT